MILPVTLSSCWPRAPGDFFNFWTFTLVAAALIAAPASIRAEDKPAAKSNSTEATTPAPKKAGQP
jgi:hypothetical protein